MELQPGTRHNSGGTAAVLFAFGRIVGFAVLSGISLAILAGVVLLPAYARLAEVRYQRDMDAADTADMEATVAANEKLIKNLPTDEELNKRLAMNRLGLWPENEDVRVSRSDDISNIPGTIQIQKHPRPAKPSSLLMYLNAKLQKQRTRRGLLLIAGLSMLGAMFLFAPPEKYREK